MATKSTAAYEIAMQMWENNPGLTKPRPETFGLTAADLPDTRIHLDPVAAKIRDDMARETGVKLPDSHGKDSAL